MSLSPALLWTVLSLTLCGVGVLFFFWAIFWDRARGRLRCPKCWYDMKGAVQSRGEPPWTCPECGKKTTKMRRLKRTRRRQRVAVAAAIVVALATYAMLARDRILARGWIGAVPSTVIVLWPLNHVQWTFWFMPFVTSWDTAIHDELEARLEERCFSRLDMAFLQHRILKSYKRQGVPPFRAGASAHTLPDISPRIAMPTGTQAAFYDLGFVDVPKGLHKSGSHHSSLAAYFRIEQRALIDLVLYIDHSIWMDFGGDRGRTGLIGESVLVLAPAETHVKIRSLWSELRRMSGKRMLGQEQNVALLGFDHVTYSEGTSRTERLHTRVYTLFPIFRVLQSNAPQKPVYWGTEASQIARDLRLSLPDIEIIWFSDDGRGSTIDVAGHLLIIRTTEAAHKRIADFLEMQMHTQRVPTIMLPPGEPSPFGG